MLLNDDILSIINIKLAATLTIKPTKPIQTHKNLSAS